MPDDVGIEPLDIRHGLIGYRFDGGTLGRFPLAVGGHVGPHFLYSRRRSWTGVNEVPHFLERLDQMGRRLVVQPLEVQSGAFLKVFVIGAMWSFHKPQVA